MSWQGGRTWKTFCENHNHQVNQLFHMKVISLNCYAGIVYEPLLDFIREHGPSTDIFCFQEMVSSTTSGKMLPTGARSNLLQEILKLLPEHQGSFSGMQDGFDTQEIHGEDFCFGVAMVWKKDLQVVQQKDFFIYRGKNQLVGKDWSTLGSTALVVQFKIDGGLLTVCSAHGTSYPSDKLDSPERIMQSQKILDEVGGLEGEKIIMGDFNLFPETESIRLFEKAGFKNLVVDHGIQTTRGSHMRVLFPEYETGKYGFQEFADYTFTSPGIDVNQFQVPDVPISDHLPMILVTK